MTTSTSSVSDIATFATDHGVDLDWLDDAYTWLHEHPELSGEEEKTAARLLEWLDRFDCEVTSGIGGHGITAVWRNGDGPTVLMRADFDALPVQETSGVEHPSTVDGVMHACGHDMHTTALLGLCAVMDARKDAWSGTFIALFQPAEETTSGASAMVEDGLGDKIPTPDVCLGQHIVPGRAGQVLSGPGPVMAACDSMTVTLHGRSAHASTPQNSIDPGYLAAMIVVRLQGIVGREVAPEEFAVVSVGTISAGHSNNTIPDTATLVLNCRFYDTEVRDRVYRAIERVIEAECRASDCPKPADIEYWAHGELTDNDNGVYEHVRPVFDELFGDNSVDATRWAASEDFPDIPRHFDVPYLYWMVTVTDPEVWDRAVESDSVAEDVPTNHSGNFAPADGTIDVTVRAAIAGVLSYLWKD